MRRRTAVAAIAVTVAAAAGGMSLFLAADTSSDFPDAAARQRFGSAAQPLDIGAGQVSPNDRNRIVAELSRDAPAEVRPSFDTLVNWYKHPHPEDERAARGASLRLGRFIEQTCALNLGGVR